MGGDPDLEQQALVHRKGEELDALRADPLPLVDLDHHGLRFHAQSKVRMSLAVLDACRIACWCDGAMPV